MGPINWTELLSKYTRNDASQVGSLVVSGGGEVAMQQFLAPFLRKLDTTAMLVRAVSTYDVNIIARAIMSQRPVVSQSCSMILRYISRVKLSRFRVFGKHAINAGLHSHCQPVGN
jgi:hypothetical protein